MGFFFRKRIKILPWLNLNLSKNGFGFSFGPKGCKISINPKGETYLNAGSHGFYVREKIDPNKIPENYNEYKSPEELKDSLIISKERAKGFLRKIYAMKELVSQGIITEDEYNDIMKLLDK